MGNIIFILVGCFMLNSNIKYEIAECIERERSYAKEQQFEVMNFYETSLKLYMDPKTMTLEQYTQEKQAELLSKAKTFKIYYKDVNDLKRWVEDIPSVEFLELHKTGSFTDEDISYVKKFKHLNKVHIAADEYSFTRNDFVSEYDFLSLSIDSDDLENIYTIAPEIKYLQIETNDIFTKSDVEKLSKFKNIDRVSIVAGGYEDLSFYENYSYVNIQLTDRSINWGVRLDKSNFDNVDDIRGRITHYSAYNDGESLIEYFGCDSEYEDYSLNEVKVAISKVTNKEKELVQEEYTYSKDGLLTDTQNISYVYGTFILDVSNDGLDDILVFQGSFGAHASREYACYLNNGDSTYRENESFIDVYNGSFNEKTGELIGHGSGGAGYHEFNLYKFENNEFVEKDSLSYDIEFIEDVLTMEIVDIRDSKVVSSKMLKINNNNNNTELDEFYEEYYNDGYWNLANEKWDAGYTRTYFK